MCICVSICICMCMCMCMFLCMFSHRERESMYIIERVYQHILHVATDSKSNQTMMVFIELYRIPKGNFKLPFYEIRLILM